MPTPCLVLRAGPGALLLLALLATLGAKESRAAPVPALGDPAAVVERLGELLVEHYVFEDVARDAAAQLQQQLADGRFADAPDPGVLSRRLTDALQEATHDKHLRVGPAPMPPPDLSPAERARLAARDLERERINNFGFEQLLRLPGNVGLLDLRRFSGLAEAATTAHAAMAFLSGCDALIVDLRQNGGGSPEMVRILCSYFFAESTHLNSLYWREGDQTEEFWTLEELPGPRLADVPVFVLTSAYTFSGAEEFTYNLATRKRATIVGENTGGGAHPGDRFGLPDGLSVFISTGRAINPITGTNWEGTGIAPDVACPADAALDRALELAQRAARDRRDARESALRG